MVNTVDQENAGTGIIKSLRRWGGTFNVIVGYMGRLTAMHFAVIREIIIQ